MEKRFQVFVSSTFTDLVDERRQVIQALLELDCIPAGMELFQASNEDQWSLIQQVIDDCDYYVLVIGGRYGSIDASGLSYTEKEYDFAVARGKPILAFIHGAPEGIPMGKSEDSEAARKKLEAFRDKVKQKMCRFWKSAEDLGGLVSRSLVRSIKTNPTEGWVRARYASDPEAIQKLNAQIAKLESDLSRVRTQAPPGAEHLANGADNFSVDFAYKSDVLEREFDSVRVSWDRLFGLLAPLMYDDASEGPLCQRA